jgi:predicted branched-subunit amino acid permease
MSLEDKESKRGFGFFLVGLFIGFLVGTTRTEQIYLKGIDAVVGIVTAVGGGAKGYAVIALFGIGLIVGLALGWFGWKTYNLSLLPI